MKSNKLQISVNQYVCFLICLLLMLIIPIARDKKIIGIELDGEGKEKIETLSVGDDGLILINTSEIGSKIVGYGGPTPVEIRIQNDTISKISVLPNQETPEFLGAVKNSDLLDTFDGMSLQDAALTEVDAVSGATYTSTAIINNIKTGVNYALANGDTAEKMVSLKPKLDFKWFATLVIILAGAIVPLFVRNRLYRNVQLVLNVAILGLWGGTFISYSLMVSYLTNGITQVVLIPVVLMLVTAFIYPMFGRVNHYCTWLCPYGSLQELLGQICPVKIKISPTVAKCLTLFREILWFGLMWLLWTGLWFDWMGYEPFAAFFFTDASWVVLMIAGVFLVLSLFTQRPYCRFVCPTGSLFKFSEGRK